MAELTEQKSYRESRIDTIAKVMLHIDSLEKEKDKFPDEILDQVIKIIDTSLNAMKSTQDQYADSCVSDDLLTRSHEFHLSTIAAFCIFAIMEKKRWSCSFRNFRREENYHGE